MDKKIFVVSLWVNVIADDYEEATEIAAKVLDKVAKSKLPIGSYGIGDVEETEQ